MQKILIIDDAEFILESTSTLLRFEGTKYIPRPMGKRAYKQHLK
ncbi:MAG TPA: hypothetical protein PLV01_06430 [Candidatus Kapabacteria bacterium]|nr:hypothetical protein [Candidatus Kapabacteria bacterium]